MTRCGRNSRRAAAGVEIDTRQQMLRTEKQPSSKKRSAQTNRKAEGKEAKKNVENNEGTSETIEEEV
ncbi:unnamed protein product [Amoebophrya sp. A25]|nr:unnamed protein product [Amoebophrya sp. A25]|eukprot:GSA25T00011712001.1